MQMQETVLIQEELLPTSCWITLVRNGGKYGHYTGPHKTWKATKQIPPLFQESRKK